MLVTLGLVKEIEFISKAWKIPVEVDLSCKYVKEKIRVKVENDILDIFYKQHHIWNESLREPVTMWGIESATTISKIIAMIDSGDTKEWTKLIYFEK